MINLLSCKELKDRADNGAVVVDVMTPEDYVAGHIAGAKNACIYEVAFLDRIAELVPDRDMELIVYDATGTTRAAAFAGDRLLHAGYTHVSVLAGGLAAWRNTGMPVAVDAHAGGIVPELRDGIYSIDREKSVMEWIGRNLNKRHYGKIAVRNGELVIDEGKLKTGHIILDMTTISNLDVQDPIWNDMLIRHLNSDDFFAVHRFPIASFTLSGWEARKPVSQEAFEGIVTGDLTIRDVTRPVRFPAIIAPRQDGGISAHAALDIDRTLWNVSYGSLRLFERLGIHLVQDTISLELFVVANGDASTGESR